MRIGEDRDRQDTGGGANIEHKAVVEVAEQGLREREEAVERGEQAGGKGDVESGDAVEIAGGELVFE